MTIISLSHHVIIIQCEFSKNPIQLKNKRQGKTCIKKNVTLFCTFTARVYSADPCNCVRCIKTLSKQILVTNHKITTKGYFDIDPLFDDVSSLYFPLDSSCVLYTVGLVGLFHPDFYIHFFSFCWPILKENRFHPK